MKSSSVLKKSLLATICLSVLTISACQLTENTLKADRSTHQEVQDYRDMLAPREAPLESKNSSVPDLQPYITDNSQSLKPMPLVSVAINQSIPLRDAIFELSKQADYDIQLDPRIRGSIIYTARNKPFDTVISQISEIAGLRYKFEDDTLKIELDTPYTKNYKVEYLAFTRESKSSIDTSTKVESGGGSGGGSTSGSSFGISSEAKTDFWGELDRNVKQILEANSQLNFLITAEDPQVSVQAAEPPVPPVEENLLNDAQPQAGEERSSYVSNYSAGQLVPQVPLNSSAPQTPGDVPTGSAVSPTTSPPDDQSATVASQPVIPNVVRANNQPTQVTPVQPQVSLNVNSLPPAGDAGASGSGQLEPNATYQPSYSLNKQAGLISVYATQRAHDQVDSYLDLMRRAVTSQVLIEAKVLEVELNDEFAYGINWEAFTDDNTFGVGLDIVRGAFEEVEASAFTISEGQGELETLLTAMQRFGTVHALASPRLTVLNNQSAVLNVARNQVYFEIDADQERDGDTDSTILTVDSTIKNVPEGVLINVMPSIDLDRNTVSMQVRPTISRIVDYVNDPAVALTLATSGNSDLGIESQVPIVSTKELDTVVTMDSGKTLVMGGLLEDRTESTQRAVPVLGEIPLLGAAFRGQNDAIHKSEVVILLKSTIITSGEQSVHNTDRELYRVYSQDRRPFKL